MPAAYELIATFGAAFDRAGHVMDMSVVVLDITVVTAFSFVVRGGVSGIDYAVDAYRLEGTRVGLGHVEVASCAACHSTFFGCFYIPHPYSARKGPPA